MPSKFSENLQKLPFAKMIYPAITLVFAVIVLFLFSKTILFLTNNINKVFSDNSASLRKEIPQFDMAGYELIRKRFGWPELVAPSAQETSTPPTASSTAISNATAKASSTVSLAGNTDSPQAAAEKAAIVIEVFSGPEKSEAGNALQDSLVQAGFTNTKIDSHQLILKNTIIQFKSTNTKLSKYTDLIKKIILEKYAAQTGSDLPDSADYDVSILIGKK
jgi:hypothetical protein